MNLPTPSPSYSADNESQTRRALEQEDKRNRKVGADVDIGRERLILKSPNGTRWNITIENDGTITRTAL